MKEEEQKQCVISVRVIRQEQNSLISFFIVTIDQYIFPLFILQSFLGRIGIPLYERDGWFTRVGVDR